MDYAKTQFLVKEGGYGLRVFKRRRGYMLTQAGKPVRPITWDQWNKLKAAWPDEVVKDKLSVTSVWFLVEVK